MGSFVDLTHEEIETTVNVDTLHPIYLCKTLLPKLLLREKRSAILITSSAFGTFVCPGISAYNASKAFVTYLGQGLNFELREKIDVLSYEAGRVGTKLIGQKPKGTIITVENAVKSSLRDLGYESRTNGAFIHEVVI
jgi:short-subunit dehydrogenase